MTQTQPRFHLGYRPALDGLRGMAIIMVLLDHSRILGDGFGFFGVNTFFVLSGFLITTLLIEEWDATGAISLRNFYFRRALRLLPALVAMLVAFVIYVFVVDPHGRAVRELGEAIFALFYVTNWTWIYRIGHHHFLMHTWSLSIEEQFYIIWPLVLLLLLARANRSSLLSWVFLGIFFSILTRVGLLIAGDNHVHGHLIPLDPLRISVGTDTRADSLLTGCFAGVLLASNLLSWRPWLARLFNAAAIISLIGLMVLSSCYTESLWMYYIGWFLASVCGVIMIIHLVSSSDSLLHRVLGNPFLVGVGKLSYGIYIWHFPILNAFQLHPVAHHEIYYPILVVIAVLASYYLIERPFLRLKTRFQRAT